MGMLVDGRWQDRWYETGDTGGRFVRPSTSFRDTVTADGSSGFPAEAGRYHLYVSLACPWAHRTLIFRRLKGLQSAISLGVVHPHMGNEGWSFDEAPGATGDPLYGLGHLHEIYTRADPGYTGRVTVPVLWDKQRQVIVNNESAEIIRMLNHAFDGLPGVERGVDFYPEPLRGEIDAVNERVYGSFNNGVYRAGFATTQAAYDEAVAEVFDTLDWMEERLGSQRYLAGDRITEADWRAFTTLVRFDPVYLTHFKCNVRRIVDCPNVWGYTRELYQVPGVAGTVDLGHIKSHYFGSHTSINPHRIVPLGPAVDFTLPHGRGRG